MMPERRCDRMVSDMRRVLIGSFIFVFVSAIHAQDWSAPAGNRPVERTLRESVLPSGRLITPLGETYVTGPGSFGLAISPTAKLVVTADGGPNRYALSVFNPVTSTMNSLTANWKERRKEDRDEDEEWSSVFQGVAFEGEDRLYASEGNNGRVRVVDPRSGKLLGRIELNTLGYEDSVSGDLVLDAGRHRLYIVDQANFRVAVADTTTRQVIASVRVGRLPFAIAMSPDGQRLYVTNVGLFRYSALPGADVNKPQTGVLFPVFGYPTKESLRGTKATTGEGKTITVPGLGDPNTREANSVAVIDISGSQPKLVDFIRTGLPISKQVPGGSSPSGVLATADRVYVTNTHNDTVSVIDRRTNKVINEIALRIPKLEAVRGLIPIGLAIRGERLYVAEAGINAVGVIDLPTGKVLGHLPVAWFPTRLAFAGSTLYVACAKGNGTGPNDPALVKSGHTFQGRLRKGQLVRLEVPPDGQLAELTERVYRNNGFVPNQEARPLPKEIEYVVVIVKENRTYDEVFGEITEASNGEVNGKPKLARIGSQAEAKFKHNGQVVHGGVMMNHLALARKFAFSDNFYADSEVSVDGHHWLVDSYPNAWTESTLMAAYGGNRDFRLSKAPGRLIYPGSNSSVHPEEVLEAGSLWHHLDRFGVTFRNYGEGYELAGGYEGEGAKPSGERLFTNIAIADPLYRNTSRNYAQYNTNIPDQYRVEQFTSDVEQRFIKGSEPFPHFIFIHLPNDHMAGPRPEDGYPHEFSYAADNDLALGKIVSYLSHSPWWKKMAILVTEDDSQGGVDHVDSHRTVLLAISPYAKRNYASHEHSNFTGLLKTAFRLLHLPPLNQFDAAATDLADCFQATPDFTPYDYVWPSKEIFDPALAKDPLDPKPSSRMDDPRELDRQHRQKKP